MSAATSEGLSAALVKADNAIRGDSMSAFETELMSRGLTRQEANRVFRWYLAQWRLNRTQYDFSSPEQRNVLDDTLRFSYGRGVGRLFWDSTAGSFGGASRPFTDRVNQLIAEADQQQESQQ